MFPTHEFQKSKEYSILLTVEKEKPETLKYHISLVKKYNSKNTFKKLTNFNRKMYTNFDHPVNFHIHRQVNRKLRTVEW